MRFGFAILNHSGPRQLLRLGRTLKTLFPDSAVVCHHDFSQCRLSVGDYSGVMDFVLPSHVTKWGHFSVLGAAISGIRQLMAAGGIDWFFLISGTTYPIKSREKFVTAVNSLDADAAISATPIHRKSSKESGHWLDEELRSRYLRLRVVAPTLDENGMIRRCVRCLPDWRLFRPFLPYSQNCRPYYGSHYFSGNAQTAKMIVDSPKNFQRLFRHMRNTPLPEEHFYHTVIANTSGLRWVSDDHHYIKWINQGAHPKELDSSDFEEICSTPALWARKIIEGRDGGLLNSIDECILR